MTKYVMLHIANKVYLKRYERLNLNHYTNDIREATVFDSKGILRMKNKLKYPDHFEVKRVSEIAKRK